MTKGGNEPKERKPLAPVIAGSGITEHTRPPTILDDAYRDRALRGGLVDGRVSRTPAPLIQEFRKEVEQFCRAAFADEGLPDPFSFIHPAGKFTPLDGKDVMARGLDYIKSRFDLGYHLAAIWYTRGEDHSHLDGPAARSAAKLWYAARLAAEFTTLDIVIAKLGANDEPHETLLMYAAQTGVQLGHLMEESKFKEKYEAVAMSRLSSTAALKESRANIDRADDAKEWHAQARLAAQRIRKRKPYLKSKRRMAQLVIKELQDDDPTFDKSERTIRRVI